MKRVLIENLKAGQEVVIANCTGRATVVKRLEKNLYVLLWQGREVTVARSNICVHRDGRWVRY